MIIDLTHQIQDALPAYPGDLPTRLIQTKHYAADYHNNHQLTISMHTGTHIDGPMHLTDCTQYLSDFSLDSFIGQGCLLNVYGQATIEYKEKYEEQIKENHIVLLHTGHSQYYGTNDYFTTYPVVSPEFAELLVRKKVKMLGLDTPAPDKIPFEIHKYLFKNQIFLIENLTNLKELGDVESFEVIALPLHIRADSAIARVVARVKE